MMRDHIAQGEVCERIADLPSADITFICTPDATIESIATELADNPCLKENSIVLHCSGAKSSSSLNALKAKNIYIASAHPLRSFTHSPIALADFAGTYCAIEGDAKACEVITALYQKIAAIPFIIGSDQKALYHAAAVFSCNYMVTLFDKAQQCLQAAAIDADIAFDMSMNLIEGTLRNLQHHRCAKKALTGPIKRADNETIEQHMRALKPLGLDALYTTLALETLEIASLNPTQQLALQHRLGSLDQSHPGNKSKKDFKLKKSPISSG